jgi:hypothetical protein
MAQGASSSISIDRLCTSLGAPSSRIEFLKAVASAETGNVLDYLNTHESLTSPAPDAALQQNVDRLTFVNTLATLTGENSALTRGLLADSDVKSIRDIALKYNSDDLEQLLAPKTAVKTSALRSSRLASTTPDPKALAVSTFQDALFNEETSAFIQKMCQNGQLFSQNSVSGSSTKPTLLASTKTSVSTSTAPDPVQTGIAQVLQNKPDFHFRKHGISQLLADPTSFTNVPDGNKAAIVDGLKTISLAQALTTTPKALPTLVRSRLSAFRIAQLPQDQFIKQFGGQIGGADVAQSIHDHAIQSASRNDHALTSILQMVRGTGLAAIDGTETSTQRISRLSDESSNFPEQIDLEKLFGSLDYCEYSDCTSVTSPAAYFVELLQFLRNNNLSPDTPWSQWDNIEDFRSTPLDYLLRRRPDLACLELTCANTNTVLPYIDLANEVMESFIYHLQRYVNSSSSPKQAWIDIFNAFDNTDELGGSTEELLAVPQNINMEAYLALQQSVYPAAKLPYNRPVNAIRQFLIFLGTSRAELLRVFQAKYNPITRTTPDIWSEVTCPPTKTKAPPPCPPDAHTTECSDSDEGDGYEDSYDGSLANGVNEKDPDGFNDLDDDSENDGYYGNGAGGSSSGAISIEDQATLSQIHQEALIRAVAASVGSDKLDKR